MENEFTPPPQAWRFDPDGFYADNYAQSTARLGIGIDYQDDDYERYKAEFLADLAAHDAEVRADEAAHWAQAVIDSGQQGERIGAARAGVVAEEPEWEYGIRAEGDDEPYTDHSDDPDWLCDQITPEHGDAIVRRRKAGPWVSVQQEEESNV